MVVSSFDLYILAIGVVGLAWLVLRQKTGTLLP